MVWHTHRLAWIALPILVLGGMSVTEVSPTGVTSTLSALYHINLLVLPISIFLANLPDYDQNQWNTPADVWENMKKQWALEQSLRILLKTASNGEHRWFTHSLLFAFIILILLSPLLLIGFGVYDLLFLIIGLLSHAFLDMFNNSGAAILYPIKTKFNFLNIIPNLLMLKTNKKEQVRVSWWNLPIWIRVILLLAVSILYTITYVYLSQKDLNFFIHLIVAAPFFYVFLKTVFVTTGSEEEVILWQYSLITLIIILIIFNFGWLAVAFLNATNWLAHHPFILITIIIFLAVRWVSIFSKDWKRFFDTKEMWGAICGLMILWSLIQFPTIVKEIWNIRNEEQNISFVDTYKKSIDKLKKEASSMFKWEPILLSEKDMKNRSFFSSFEEMKQNWIKREKEIMQQRKKDLEDTIKTIDNKYWNK